MSPPIASGPTSGPIWPPGAGIRSSSRSARRCGPNSRRSAFFDEYADAAAKPRVERAIAQGLRQRTGSHTGFDAGLIISSIGPGNQLFGSVGGVNLKDMYDASRTDPKKYWACEDMVWKNGLVKVGEIENVPTERVPAEAATPDAGKPEAAKP